MNCWLFSIFCIVLSSELSNGNQDWTNELKEINKKLSEISNKIVSSEKFQDQYDILKLKIDLIDNKLDNGNRRLQSIENNIKRIPDTCYKSDREIEHGDSERLKHTKDDVLSTQLDDYGNKILKGQMSIKNISTEQLNVLYNLRNRTTTGFNKLFAKLEIMITSNDIKEALTVLSSSTEILSKKSFDQELKLNDFEDKLSSVGALCHSLKNFTKNKFEEFGSNISKHLDNQKADISPEAVFRVSVASNMSKNLADEMKYFRQLEPKLIHVFRLLKELTNYLKVKNTQDSLVIANNLTSSLQALTSTVPLKVLHVTEVINSLQRVLLELKNMGNPNDSSVCQLETIIEIRNHHAEMLKLLNNMDASVINKNEKTAEGWNMIMTKLANIQKVSNNNDSILDTLHYIRGEIRESREILRKIQQEAGNDDFEEDTKTTFGRK